jgi:membrane associated rhomboid family serine protease
VWWSQETANEGQWWRLATSMFAHGGVLHLVFNAVALLSLSTLERRLGTQAFAGIFLAAGLGGGIAHVATTEIPTVGASGAIFGLLGVLLLLAPTTQLNLFFLPVPAVVLMPLYLSVVLLVPGFSELAPIAHWAHLGGLFVGMAAGLGLAPRQGAKHLAYIALVFAATLVLVTAVTEMRLDHLVDTYQTQGLVQVLAETWQAWLSLVVIFVAVGLLESEAEDAEHPTV